MKKTEKTRLILFLSFFGITGTFLTIQWGLATGIYTTMLVWSFFVLCFPIPQSALITSRTISLVTKKSLLHAGVIVWIIALSLNIVTYLAFPYIYMKTNTTFLLYRIITNPWPYWLIIGTSTLGGIYKAIAIKSTTNLRLFWHVTTKAILFFIGVTTLFYLSYNEIIILLVAKMS
ncbi:hypothetical protein KKA53_00315 [Candidatus Dependentiae bacterium]|nr:hypothetical protein [Candidatus Dependentiae bacterium]